jgi:integrase
MSTHENTAQEKQDIYARVTSQIVSAIERGVSNWRMPWHTSGKFAFSPIDVTSKKRKIGIPYGSNPETCPVRTVQAWLEQAAVTGGPLFRSINRHGRVQAGRLSDIDVARVVKKLAERAGLDAAKYAGHSLRAGHATSAAIAGASERSIMNQTGHRSVQNGAPVHTGWQSVSGKQGL